MKMCTQLRFRDLISETLSEFSRMENLCRIYPAKNSKLYDKYFSGSKPLNKILYKVLYSNEILQYSKSFVEKSTQPVPSKANSLISQQALKSGLPYQDRIQSSAGARPVANSKSNQKLTIQKLEEQKQSYNRTGSESPSEKRERLNEQQHSLPKQRNGSLPAQNFSGVSRDKDTGSTRNVSSAKGSFLQAPQTTKSLQAPKLQPSTDL